MTGVMLGVMAVVLLVGMLGLGGHHGGSGGQHGKIDGNEKQETIAQHDNRDVKGEKLYPHNDAPPRESKRETTVAKYDACDEMGRPSEDVSKACEEALK
ncbi:MAG: hypothetical protein C0402_12485 [Thermodesulfovibrio sp.]|nr:hypothetical protein [Thermodesulfovibrio sp.]